MSTRPILTVVHRRNKISQLHGLPAGCWIEIDVEIYENQAYLTHDPIQGRTEQALPDLLETFIPLALKNGVAGFVVDCKRECAEKWVEPLFKRLGITDFFYLNEMEVQADIFQSQDATHNSGIRVWKYRGASDIIRFAQDMRTAGESYPSWIWVDCWQRGLLNDITKAHLPMTGDEAHQLQALGVKLCLCSPELYVHKYDTAYDDAALSVFFKGMLDYREKVESAGLRPDSICTKFPHIWFDDLNQLRQKIK